MSTNKNRKVQPIKDHEIASNISKYSFVKFSIKDYRSQSQKQCCFYAFLKISSSFTEKQISSLLRILYQKIYQNNSLTI